MVEANYGVQLPSAETRKPFSFDAKTLHYSAEYAILRVKEGVFMDQGLTLEAVRFVLKQVRVRSDVRLVAYQPGRFAICFRLEGGGYGKKAQGWLLSEKSKRVRTFAKAETAFSVLHSLGVTNFLIDLEPDRAGLFYCHLPFPPAIDTGVANFVPEATCDS